MDYIYDGLSRNDHPERKRSPQSPLEFGLMATQPDYPHLLK